MSDETPVVSASATFAFGVSGRTLLTLVSDALDEGCVLVAEHNLNNKGGVTLGQASRQNTHQNLIVVPSGGRYTSIGLVTKYFEVEVRNHNWPGYPQTQDFEAQEQAIVEAVHAFAFRLTVLYEQALSDGR